jgi:hypothetical protein
MDASKATKAKNAEPLKASSKLRRALRARGRGVGTISWYYSSKNDLDVVFPADLEFAHGLLLDADESVKSWDNDPDRVIAYIEREGFVGSKPDAVVYRRSGAVSYREVKYSDSRGSAHATFQAEAQRRAAEQVGAEWSWFTEADVLAQERLLHDWIHIAPVLAQTRVTVRSRWDWLRKEVLEQARGGTTLGDLRKFAKDPWDLVFSATFRLVHFGILSTDLAERPLSATTKVWVRGSSHG